MVTIDIPLIKNIDIFIGDGTTKEFIIQENAMELEVIVSGIYLTIDEDYTYDINKIVFIEVPLLEENINIKYNI